MAKDFNIPAAIITIVVVAVASYVLSEGNWLAPVVVVAASLLALVLHR